jgi:Zn finger protein HypA/HybF involved in hydrogenase expression
MPGMPIEVRCEKCEGRMTPLISLSNPNASEFYCPACHISMSAEKMSEDVRQLMAQLIQSKQRSAAMQEQTGRPGQ